MGCFDTFGDVQLKNSEQRYLCRTYFIGDVVSDEFEDGVYIGHEGVVVIVNHIFVAQFPHIWTKWGAILNPHDLLMEC